MACYRDSFTLPLPYMAIIRYMLRPANNTSYDVAAVMALNE
jgi:cbb3-type cytochrome oxidase subunit 3